MAPKHNIDWRDQKEPSNQIALTEVVTFSLDDVAILLPQVDR